MSNRIEDLIEKARHYENLWHEALDDNKRLKAEVERLDTLCKQLMTQHSDISCENIMLRKAGDYLCSTMDTNGIHDNGDYEMHDKAIAQWSAAKEGKPSV